MLFSLKNTKKALIKSAYNAPENAIHNRSMRAVLRLWFGPHGRRRLKCNIMLEPIIAHAPRHAFKTPLRSLACHPHTQHVPQLL